MIQTETETAATVQTHLNGRSNGHSLETLPKDEHNLRLIRNVHPPDWQNPAAEEKYNLVVIGAGTGGLITAAGSVGLGAKVALVEKHLMGGDCLNVGCVPSKAIIRSAKVMGDITAAADFGINVPEGVNVDFGQVMARLRRVRADISQVDAARRYQDLGVDVFLGTGRFIDQETIEVDGKRLKFKKAVVATGSRPVIPDIDGLAEAGYLTNETVFNLTEQPKSLAVIGGGPIGAELAQAFQRLGTKVTLLHNADHILNREDAEAARIVQQVFVKEGIELALGTKVHTVTTGPDGKTLHFDCPEGPRTVTADEILVSTGRAPNIDGLGLEEVGVETDPRQGIIVDDYLQTTNSNIYAVGDVAVPYKFTHIADATARIVIRNALFFGREKVSDLVIPWTTYTDPEIAHVGLYEQEAEAQGLDIDTFTAHFDDVDRAIADGEENGFVKVHVKKGTDKILGATIVARTAGDMLSELTLAIVADVGLGTIAKTIHAYPTQAEAIKKVADAYNRTRLTPTVKKLFSGWLNWTR